MFVEAFTYAWRVVCCKGLSRGLFVRCRWVFGYIIGARKIFDRGGFV